MPRLLLAVLVAIALAATACSGAIAVPRPSSTKDPISGVYIARGGGGALDNVTPLLKAFVKLHPNVVWQGLDDIGSDPGIKLVVSGDIDMSFISRELKPAEVGTVATLPIGVTGTGIAVNRANQVGGVTSDQLGKIFNGSITTWSALGGDATTIRVLVREAGSATRNALEALCYGGKAPPTGYAKNSIEVGSYDETLKAMQSLPGAVGMMSMSTQALAEPAIRFLSIDGVAATRESLADGSYKMRRPLYLVYPVDPAKVAPAVRAFLDFVKSPDGQAVLGSL